MSKSKKSKNKAKAYKIHNLPSIRASLKISWEIYRRNSWLFVRVGVLAAAVNYILGLLVDQDAPQLVGQLWFTIMLAIFVWTSKELSGESGSKKTALSDVFYQGSSSFIKQMLVLAVWVVYLVPFLIGAQLSIHIGMPRFGANSLEVIIVNSVWLLLGATSGYWVIRSLFAPFRALDARPLLAIRESWQLTKKLVSRLTLRLFVGALAASAPVLLVFGLVYLPVFEYEILQVSMAVVFNVLLLTFTFPFLIIYIYQSRPYEQSKKPRRKIKK